MSASVSPIRKPAPLGNLRPISDPRITADALVRIFDALDKGRPSGLCSTRWLILCEIYKHQRAHGPDSEPTRAALKLAAGLKDNPLSEHLRGLRFKGLVLFEALKLSPSATLMVERALGASQEVHEGDSAGRPAMAAEPHLRVGEPETGVVPAPAPKLKTIDAFAEYLAEGLSVREAAERLGKHAQYGQALLNRIRARLGAQAI